MQKRSYRILLRKKRESKRSRGFWGYGTKLVLTCRNMRYMGMSIFKKDCKNMGGMLTYPSFYINFAENLYQLKINR